MYIQFSHALYKQKHNLYISLLFVEVRKARVASEIWKRRERRTKIYVFIQFSLLYTIRNNFYTLVFV